MPLPLPDASSLWAGAYAVGLLGLAGAPRASLLAAGGLSLFAAFAANRTRRTRLRGRSVLVTGASSGLGRCLALEAARRGASHVLLVARGEARLREVAAEVEALGAAATALPCDVSSAEGVAAMGAAARAALGGAAPDVLVNNAGAGQWRHIEDETPETVRQCLAVPAVAAMLVTREFAADMVRRRGGHVLNVTSAASLVGFRGAVAYQTARGCVRAFSDSLRADVREAGVGVTCLNALELVGTNYFAANPGSHAHIPYLFSDASPLSFCMKMTAEGAARAAFRGVERGTREVYAPGVLASLVPLQAALPGVIEWTARLGGRGLRGAADKGD